MESTCEQWAGAHRKSDGRPVTGPKQREYAYRVLWEADRGPLAPGIVLHHRCENPWCVNLNHLEPITQAEHISQHRPKRKRKEACSNGHPFTEETTFYDAAGARHCRVCRAERKRARRRAEGRPERPSRRRL